MIQPLSNKELGELFDTLRQQEYREQYSLILNIVPFSGLTASEFRHLRSDWIDFGDKNEPVEIKIPQEDSCTPIKYGSGGNTIVKQPEPCPLCKDTSGPNKFTAENEHRVRRVHIQETRAQERLDQWFNRHDYIPISRPTAVLSTIVDRSSISREIRWIDLRHTYTRILGDQGFDLYYIAKWLGYPDRGWQSLPMEFNRVLRNTNTDYSGYYRLKDYYATLAEHEPLTSMELSKHVGKTRIHTKRKLNDLVEKGWAEEIGPDPDRDGEPGLSPTQYKTIESADVEFPCSHCDKIYDTYRGKMAHERKAHKSE